MFRAVCFGSIFFFFLSPDIEREKRKGGRNEGRKREGKKKEREGRNKGQFHKSYVDFSRDFYHVFLLLKTKTESKTNNKKKLYVICNVSPFYFFIQE